MMEVQLLQGLHHAWRGRMCWVLNGFEREGNSKPKTTAALRRGHKTESHIQNLRVITEQQAADYLQPELNSADLGEMLWDKSYLWSLCFHRESKNGTEWNIAKKGQKEKRETTEQSEDALSFSMKQERGTWREQKYPKGASKTMPGCLQARF